MTTTEKKKKKNEGLVELTKELKAEIKASVEDLSHMDFDDFAKHYWDVNYYRGTSMLIYALYQRIIDLEQVLYTDRKGKD